MSRAITQNETKTKKRKETGGKKPTNKTQSISERWDNFKQPNVLRVPKGEKSWKETEKKKYFGKTLAKHFPNLMNTVSL